MDPGIAQHAIDLECEDDKFCDGRNHANIPTSEHWTVEYLTLANTRIALCHVARDP